MALGSNDLSTLPLKRHWCREGRLRSNFLKREVTKEASVLRDTGFPVPLGAAAARKGRKRPEFPSPTVMFNKTICRRKTIVFTDILACFTFSNRVLLPQAVHRFIEHRKFRLVPEERARVSQSKRCRVQ